MGDKGKQDDKKTFAKGAHNIVTYSLYTPIYINMIVGISWWNYSTRPETVLVIGRPECFFYGRHITLSL